VSRLFLLGFGPDLGSFVLAEELDVNHVGVAADGAVFDVLLFQPATEVEWYHDLLAACRADVNSLVLWTMPFVLPLLHVWFSSASRSEEL
jgi:hypothetical protein